jgi:hypothetical protein
MRASLLVLCVALGTLIHPGDARGRPAGVPAPQPVRAGSSGGVHLSLPPGWHAVVVHGGYGSSPFGVAELVVANFPVPRTARACESWSPRISRDQALLRVYDYGATALPGAKPARRLRLGVIQPTLDPAARGVSMARMRFHGDTVIVEAAFGARTPPAALLHRVDRLLGSAALDA